MKYVFGPVPSRRLGQSLGIDPIPSKTCNWNCVYCQLGRSTPMTNERRVYCPPDVIVTEVLEALKAHRPGEIDWITFVGSGEPTLHAGLGGMIRRIRSATRIPLAVITNGALMYRPEIREELAEADAVLPSLDAGTAGLHRRINRPWPELTYRRLIEGLVAFRREYRGRLWIEVMLVRGLNDTHQALLDLASVVERIGPDAVQINRPIRPPAEPWVKPADAAAFARAEHLLGRKARVVETVQKGLFDLAHGSDPLEAVLSIVARHPMSQDELVSALECQWPAHSDELLQRLRASGRARLVGRHGRLFWTASEACHPIERRGKRRRATRARRTQKMSS
jgi:wyosine [tRNA(Phe)-imidazoG37] synthetase (radical SAM superfamily)